MAFLGEIHVVIQLNLIGLYAVREPMSTWKNIIAGSISFKN
jgi:hypothetical protein